MSSNFVQDINKVFPRAKLFMDEKYARFSQEMLSNLLGGLGFFHGNAKVDGSHAPEYEEVDTNFWVNAASAMTRAEITTTESLTLLSHTPSRPFFPRGFLWDEGFHLLPVIEWDLDLAVSVLQSWLKLMDDDGWIGREQILGPEARNRVPEKFQVQYPHYANPPTLLALLVPILISKITGESQYIGHPSVYLSSPEQSSTLLEELYPLLARHYNWFRHTQAGNFTTAYPRPKDAIDGEGYRWRGRTPMHTLTSGLDDYPRANPPHPGELHVDALAWVGASARALQQLTSHLNLGSEAAMYRQQLADVKQNLGVLHWNSTSKTYCDTTIDNNKFAHVCHEGYISLYPLLVGLLDDPDHPNLPALLDLLSDESKLWSPHGLRSLSAADPNYGKDEDYWRGPVWMNLNVLAVLRLRDVALALRGDDAGIKSEVQKRALSLAAELRKRVVETVFNSWEATGFFWEQYSDKTGEGKHSRAFTGWTACVILLMGLDFGHGDEGSTGADGNAGVSDPDFGGSMSDVSTLTAAIGVVGLLVVAAVFRRRLFVVFAYLVERIMGVWRSGIRGKTGRGTAAASSGQGYEMVVDLEERERYHA